MRKRNKSSEKKRKADQNESVPARIATARRALGISKPELAKLVGVSPTTVRAWENGSFSPRDGRQRAKLATALKLDVAELSRAIGRTSDSERTTVRTVETLHELPSLSVRLLKQARATVKDLRLAAPYLLPPFVQTEFRKAVSARILDKTIEVQRVEIFYTLDRLREVLANVLRYDGCAYFVRSFCPGLKEVVPSLGGYAFDDSHVVLGGYFVSVPPHDRPGLYVHGEPVREFFRAYWDEIWRRGTPLNLSGAAELSAIRRLAVQLGLRESDWDQFVKEASVLQSTDGAPLRI